MVYYAAIEKQSSCQNVNSAESHHERSALNLDKRNKQSNNPDLSSVKRFWTEKMRIWKGSQHLSKVHYVPDTLLSLISFNRKTLWGRHYYPHLIQDGESESLTSSPQVTVSELRLSPALSHSKSLVLSISIPWCLGDGDGSKKHFIQKIFRRQNSQTRWMTEIYLGHGEHSPMILASPSSDGLLEKMHSCML